jgi:hypothetical protein
MKSLLVRAALGTAVLLLASTALHADLIQYTFTGANDLSGTFYLDGDTPLNVVTGSWYTSASLISPRQTLSGTYGNQAFASNDVQFYVTDYAPSGSNSDSWMIRSFGTYQINGQPYDMFNLFIYWLTDTGTMPISIDVPVHYTQNIYGFSYAFGNLQNPASFIGGELLTLEQVPDPAAVPEPSSLMLLGAGFFVILAERARRRSSR